jgi:hypothetical protein
MKAWPRILLASRAWPSIQKIQLYSEVDHVIVFVFCGA